jgi:hypothetical protein
LRKLLVNAPGNSLVGSLRRGAFVALAAAEIIGVRKLVHSVLSVRQGALPGANIRQLFPIGYNLPQLQ